MKSADRSLLWIFGVVLGIRLFASGQESGPAAAAAPSAVATNPVLRDPFWPVGYTPKPKLPPETRSSAPPATRRTLPAPGDWPTLKMTGLMQSPQGPLAIIEGVGVVEEGAVVRQRSGGFVYRWRIDRITADRLIYTKLDVRPADGL